MKYFIVKKTLKDALLKSVISITEIEL